MDKYIKIEDVAKNIEELQFTMSMCLSEDECLGMRRAQDIIARYVRIALPAAAVEKRKTGKWAKQQKDFNLCGVEYFACSQCGFECQLAYNFCPYCGADMQTEECDY